MRAYASVSAAMGIIMIGLGVALLAVTLIEGGGQVGILVGVLFAIAGCGRLYLARRR